jgi:hypothetical protein
MRRSSELALFVVLALGAAALAAPVTQTPVPVFAIGKLTYVEKQVETAGGAGAWQAAREGSSLRMGERLRTGPAALARIELPWMAFTVSPAATLSFPDQDILSAVLEQGRLALSAEAREIMKVVTPEAEVRGRGRVVVRRDGQRTLVTAISGRFTVEGAGQLVVLAAGKGTVVPDKGRPTAPVDAPEPPRSLKPGTDPIYVAPGEPVDLTAATKGASNIIELLPVGSDVVLMQRDVGAPPWKLEVPWPGAFRWRVASRDERGLEGRPSADGGICVDEN